ncbi:MAG: hypothetical protein JO246_08950 [Frankiaceae bacterium]|nr:hypothetical protein [Frankiaceae bacterium]MBV9869069.1 hypothetical protein [Frankiaceae bacterium]
MFIENRNRHRAPFVSALQCRFDLSPALYVGGSALVNLRLHLIGLRGNVAIPLPQARFMLAKRLKLFCFGPVEAMCLTSLAPGSTFSCLGEGLILEAEIAAIALDVSSHESDVSRHIERVVPAHFHTALLECSLEQGFETAFTHHAPALRQPA